MNWIHRAVNRLPKERQIIYMYYMEEKGYVEYHG